MAADHVTTRPMEIEHTGKTAERTGSIAMLLQPFGESPVIKSTEGNRQATAQTAVEEHSPPRQSAAPIKFLQQLGRKLAADLKS
mmetsp:Transcript_5942/g.13725  ORF Transcript_5942/g.13725 Transcript_5942/m.13725 type:complete len:84 (-) Transcript_5942:59-310(-)